MSLESLPPLKDSLIAQGIVANKAFGQNFLLDLNVTRKIARLAAPLEGRLVFEVGPGPGGLTRALLEAGAEVVAIEKDRRFRPILDELSEAASGRLRVVEADAMRSDFPALAAEHAAGRPVQVVANLPYNVGTPLLIGWLTGPFRYERLTLMFQKEVAERIAAAAGEEAYGRLSVLAQATSRPRIVMSLPARAFTPAPKVDSAVVQLDPLVPALEPARLARLERITQAAFGQRRKMLRSSLKGLGGDALCLAAGVDPGARAETIPVEGFLALADALAAPPPPTRS